MPVIIGTDEAGYGPNLGPLVIAATKWKTADQSIDLRSALQGVVGPVAQRADERWIEVADSKQLYSSGQSLARLERGVLAFARLGEERFESFTDFLSVCGDSSWLQTADDDIYVTASRMQCPGYLAEKQLLDDCAGLKRKLRETGVEFCGIQVHSVFPDQFNDLLATHQNKANLLSYQTLSLVRRLMDQGSPHRIICDKHGGRNKYAGLIQHCLTDSLVRIHGEALEQSNYSWPNNTIEFVAKGEFELPVALASMAAKYVRERMMAAWNQFWVERIPGLKPTAGYPVDAKRFKKAIMHKQRELGISDHQIWRAR